MRHDVIACGVLAQIRPGDGRAGIARNQADMNDQDETPQRTTAKIKRSRAPGWIWVIPVAALILVGWLGIRALATKGTQVTVTFDKADGLKQGDTRVTYRGVEVGKVDSIALSKDGTAVEVRLTIKDGARNYLRAGTLFWLKGAEPSLSDPDSLSAMISGPTIVMSPGTGPKTRVFRGLDSPPALQSAIGARLAFLISFPGDVGALKAGAPVKLRGFTVGEVKDIAFRYDPASQRVEAPVTIVIDPARFHIAGAKAQSAQDWARIFDPVLNELIAGGLRARLSQTPPLVGGYEVDLDTLPGAAPAVLDTSGQIPEIPAAAGGGLESIVSRVNTIPIDQIADNILAISHDVREIVSSPKIDDSLDHLDSTLAEINSTVETAAPQVSELVTSLRKSADQLDAAAHSVQGVLGGPAANQAGNLAMTLHELTDAARSVRSLADYLDRHPEALIRGKPQ